MNKKLLKLTMIILLTAFLLVAGCQYDQKTTENLKEKIKPDTENKQSKKLKTNKRFEEQQKKQSSVVESAMKLSERYAKLSNEMSELKDKNAKLLSENKRLKKQYEKTKMELERTNKELKEANDLLIEMRMELNNWKADVLGFRDEMREANSAQMEALFKILKLLGGEFERTETKDVNDPNRTGTGKSEKDEK